MSHISLQNNNIELNDILESVRSLSYAKEEQEKSIEITSGGTQVVLPDDGKTLSKVIVSANMSGGNVDGNVDFLTLKTSLASYSNDNVKSIGGHAFAGCSSLTSFVVLSNKSFIIDVS